MPPYRFFFLTAGLTLSVAVDAATAAAQVALSDSASRAGVGPLVRGRDVAALGAFAAAALAVAPADRRIARWSQRSSVHADGFVDHTASVVRTLGGPGTVVIPLATYGAGVLTRNRGTAAVGLHTGEAVVAASLVTTVLKAAVGRARPYVSHDSDATSFGFGRGLRGGDAYQSFPSGHATVSFALAAALAGEGRARWPRVNRVTGPIGFGVATLVAASRVYHNAHWASDVVAGAGVGAVVGGVVARYAREHPGALLEPRLLPRAGAVSRGDAPVVGYTLRF